MFVCRERASLKKEIKVRLQGLILTPETAAGRAVLMRLTPCVCGCCGGGGGGVARGGSGGSGGARPSALSFTARPPSKSCTAPTGVPNSPSRSSAGQQ